MHRSMCFQIYSSPFFVSIRYLINHVGDRRIEDTETRSSSALFVNVFLCLVFHRKPRLYMYVVFTLFFADVLYTFAAFVQHVFAVVLLFHQRTKCTPMFQSRLKLFIVVSSEISFVLVFCVMDVF